MYLRDNPVLQRELLVNLRMPRGFLLLGAYQLLLALVVFSAWPQEERLDLTENPQAARQLGDLFFLGQYLLAAIMSPSFAAGAITGEKERQTYEMLLASPLRPGAIVLGKLIASLTHLAILIFASLPIVMLCLPLGGISFYEVLAAYWGMLLSVLTFGMISIACSSYFKRTSSSLAVSYLLILPLALLAVFFWFSLSNVGWYRLWLTVLVTPAVAITLGAVLFTTTRSRLLHPPDVGSEGEEVVDLAQEAERAVGLVIERDQFPDRLFAPAKRQTLMEDGVNPVYEKEIGSEIFSQGTLMLRIVIQVSIAMAILPMAFCLYIYQQHTPWYVAYLLLFNMLVGPVFSAGSITGEREKQTLDLLLTTLISPWQILSGKLLAGLRVSSVLTFFLAWPMLLAAVLVQANWINWRSFLAYLGIVALTCVTTALVALVCSVHCRKTSQSLLASYLILLTLFTGPLATNFLATRFHPDSEWTRKALAVSLVSPIQAVLQVPLRYEEFEPGGWEGPQVRSRPGSWQAVGKHVAFTLGLNVSLLVLMLWQFHRRWRVA
jgi:ABC-type transport system involved in multi-copper enzyme maturation permease subunit